MSAQNHVFFDPTGRRARFLSASTYLVAAALIVCVVCFVATLLIAHGPRRSEAIASLFQVSPQHNQVVKPTTNTSTFAQRAIEAKRQADRVVAAGRLARSPSQSQLLSPANGRPLSIAFYVNWDDDSHAALQQHLGNIDVLMPTWLSLTGSGGLRSDIDRGALDIVASNRPNLPILPVIQNEMEGDNWDGPGLAKLISTGEGRATLVAQITSFVTSNRFNGVTLDFEEVPTSAQPDLQTFVGELHAAFAPLKLTLAITLPYSDDDWDYRAYGQLADFAILMAYDEHWAQSAPGSIASQEWYETILDQRMKELDPSRTVIAIGGYGYDWVPGHNASDVTFQDAMQAATDSESDIEFDAGTNNPHFTYTEDDGSQHNVWFLDGVTAYNEIHAADVYQPAGYALWRLGSEDPSLWSVMGRPYGSSAPDALRVIPAGGDININGSGELLRVKSRPISGARSIELEGDSGDVSDETYTSLPMSYSVQRLGDADKKIALTFDDGPDPQWTPQILDVLEQRHVPATFFIVGENAAAHPELVRRLVDDGFEVGNHSYTHPNFGIIPDQLARIEINATQRLFEATTGRSLRLFRPPFLGDSEPSTSAEVSPIDTAQAMGYLTVGLRIDPDDWARPGTAEIVARTLSQATSTDPDVRGNIVLLHDSGGDRSETVAALPQIIDQLRAKGYQFVLVSDLAGLSRDQAMPTLPAGSNAALIDGYAFKAINTVGNVMPILFEIAIVLGITRAVVMAVLAMVNHRKESRQARPPLFAGTVSVIIPAFNEAKVIVPSIRRVLDSRDASVEVIVVDDGSSDITSDLVRSTFGSDRRVTLLTVANGGKARALNLGLREASGEVVVALDADTQFEPQTIAHLAKWFEDSTIGAVAGNAKVGNRHNMVTRWQGLEYITAQNLERRALAAIGSITVVPGAVGAWRRSLLSELGGFPDDTLAEDQDLTIAVLRNGHRVVFDSEAIAWTEAPSSFGALAQQRFRWAFGTLQCLWKYRTSFLNPRHGMLGLVGLPQAALFQVALALLSPLVDLLFIGQTIRAILDVLFQADSTSLSGLEFTLLCLVVFSAVDVLCAAVAFAMEKNERWRLLLWLPLQRFGYRQIMYFVVCKSVVKALSGLRVGWGKLERTATVSM